MFDLINAICSVIVAFCAFNVNTDRAIVCLLVMILATLLRINLKIKDKE
ncbi:MAG: hypothetical protein K0Q53_104 [Massilibacillus sp.]|jgi:hypothetical protein|nr:hypothetical protein [Massilibacillus sp.]